MISLSDDQLKFLMATASRLPVEQRSEFLQQVADRLEAAVQQALQELHRVTAA
jgi:hypothetical protein